MPRRLKLVAFVTLALLSGCEQPEKPAVPPLATTASNLAAAPRTNGSVASPALPAPNFSYGTQGSATTSTLGAETGAGPYSLEFADTDIREVVAQILGGLLHVNYSIDPAVHGTVTLHTGQPLSGRQLLPTLQNLLANAGAVLLPDEGLYRVVPATAAGAAGSLIIPLRYVSAEELAKVLQPLAGQNAKVASESGLNALLISGDPAQVQAVRDLVRTFDTDELANQSYAVLPVSSGGAKDFADAMQEAFKGKSGGALSGLVRVVPLPRLNAVLIISSQPRYIDAARQVFALVERQRRNTVRSWHVFYLQSSNANDIAYTLQMAFTPNNVTAVPEAQQGGGRRGLGGGSIGGGSGQGGTGFGSGGGLGGSGGGIGGGSLGGGSSGGLGGAGGGISSLGGANPLAPSDASGGTGGGRAGGAVAAAAGNPLLGGLDQGSGGEDNADNMRILPNAQNNAVLIYSTPQEQETVVGMLRKIDIVPMQVRIDATIAEVTLNDALQYGTQFFFKGGGGINGILNTPLNASPTAVGNPANTVLGTTFPGFLLGGTGQGGAPLAISALQAVTTVNVLSSPQLTVVDNQPARLQVGALVPYLTASQQGTIAPNAPVINSIGYQPTGVILEVTPRVNSGGAVTLDISQEVSEVSQSASAGGISSPTFEERNVTSRVVVQDGQTVGMAGLIQDSISKGNQGIPWIKDIPILGALAGTQNNSRTRTELLVLITPHIIRDSSDMRKLTDDMRDALSGAAAVPSISANERQSGSADPNQRIRQRTRDWLERQTQ
jgi:general secretion pathway protein D